MGAGRWLRRRLLSVVRLTMKVCREDVVCILRPVRVLIRLAVERIRLILIAMGLFLRMIWMMTAMGFRTFRILVRMVQLCTRILMGTAAVQMMIWMMMAMGFRMSAIHVLSRCLEVIRRIRMGMGAGRWTLATASRAALTRRAAMAIASVSLTTTTTMRWRATLSARPTAANRVSTSTTTTPVMRTTHVTTARRSATTISAVS